MADEISVSAVLVEQDGGGYRANCPELGLDAAGLDADDALDNLREAIARHIRAVGPDNLRLASVKCMKIKVHAG